MISVSSLGSPWCLCLTTPSHFAKENQNAASSKFYKGNILRLSEGRSPSPTDSWKNLQFGICNARGPQDHRLAQEVTCVCILLFCYSK